MIPSTYAEYIKEKISIEVQMNLNCLLMHFLGFEQEQAKSDLLSDYLSGFPVLNPWPKVFVVIRLLEAIPIVRTKAAMAIPINIAQ
jgi:hypothetical protein